MPSPFPGMDPYVEDSDVWPGMHSYLLVQMATALNAVLPPHYVADIEQWLSIAPSEHKMEPDVLIREHTFAAMPERGGGTAVLERPALVAEESSPIADEPLEIGIWEGVYHPMYINIVRARDRSDIIATIELLSPTNKAPGRDQRAYHRKQREVCASATHLIEIDLLRGGAHTVAVPVEELDDLIWDYLVCLHEGGTGPAFKLWPCTLRERLPRIYVPLAAGETPVVLDLQAVFDQCYDMGAYRKKVNYAPEPEPPLKPVEAEWADALLREKGLRTG